MKKRNIANGQKKLDYWVNLARKEKKEAEKNVNKVSISDFERLADIIADKVLSRLLTFLRINSSGMLAYNLDIKMLKNPNNQLNFLPRKKQKRKEDANSVLRKELLNELKQNALFLKRKKQTGGV